MKSGDLVILINLKTENLNGLVGEIVGEFQIQKKRWPVRVHWTGEKLKHLKPENLWSEDHFISEAVQFCHPRIINSRKPDKVLNILSSVVAGYQTLSRDLTRRIFGDYRILEYVADYHLDKPKPDPRIWGIILFFARNPVRDPRGRSVVAKIIKDATQHLQKEWMAFRKGPNWDLASMSKEGATRLWILFGKNLGCKKIIDWAVFMWFLVLENPQFQDGIFADMNNFPNFVSKLPSFKKCSHRLRCGRCKKVEGKGVSLRQCFRCGLVRYCSSTCHQEDWEDHRKICLCRLCFHSDCGSTTKLSCSTASPLKYGIHV